MKIKHALIFLFVALLMAAAEKQLNIDDEPGSVPFIYFITGALFKTVGFVILIIKLISYPRLKEFLNW